MNRLRKIPKKSWIYLLVVLALFGIFHLWLISHAKTILSEIVRVQSNGKYQLKANKVKYNYLHLRLEVQQPVLTSLDTSNDDRFEMHARHISIQLDKLWPLISGRELLIDSIALDEPYFSVTHQNHDNPSQQKRSFSLSLEMEKLYQSIQSVLNTLKVGNFRINKGIFALNYSPQKKAQALQIKDIDFYIKGLKIDSSSISQDPNSYTEDIQLSIGAQTIKFPEARREIRFSSFRLIGNTGNLEVDSCNISGGDTDSATASFNLFAEKMRIRNVYLASQDSADFNRIDSLFFTRPKVSFSVKINDVKADSSSTISKAIDRLTSTAFGKMLIKYVSINNVDFDIEVERKEKISTLNFVQDSLEISNLGLGVFPSMPVSADNIRFGVKEFVDYFRDSTYLVHFDSVRINNDLFSLFSFKMESTAKVKKGEQRISIPVLQIQGIDWLQLLTQKRLVASNLTLNDPSIDIVAANNGKNHSQKKNSNIDSLLREMFLINNIAINNGTVNYAFSGNAFIHVSKINTDLSPVAVSAYGSIGSIQKMIRRFKTGEVIFQKDGWKMVAANTVYGKGNSFRAAGIDLSNDLQSLRIKATDASVSGISESAKTNVLHFDKLDWKNASIVLDLSKKKTKYVSKAPPLKLSLGAVNGGVTELRLHNNATQVTAQITRLKTAGINWTSGKPIELHNLFAEGTSIDANAGNVRIHSGNFLLNDQQASYLNSMTADLFINNRNVAINVPRINFETNIRELSQKHYVVSSLKMVQPKIRLNVSAGAPVKTIGEVKPFPSIDLTKVEITDPELIFQKNLEQSPLKLQLGKAFVTIAGIQSSPDGDQLSLKNVQLQSDHFNINDNDSTRSILATGNAKLALEAFNIYAGVEEKKGKWEVSDANLELSNTNLLNRRRTGRSDTVALATLAMRNLSLTEQATKNPAVFLSSNPAVTINKGEVEYRTEKNRFRIRGMNANSRSLSMDSFSFHPQMDKDAFKAAQQYQKDYINLETGAISVNNINTAAWWQDSVIKIGSIHIADAEVTDTRDKQLPLQADVVRELPVNMIKKIKAKTSIDSVNISNAKIVYHEVSEKTTQTGTIHFNRMKALIRNIKNHGFSSSDSLQVTASAYLMDTAFLTLRFKESYEDSLAGFPVVVKAQPFNMQILNPFLLPVMSVKIRSGFTNFFEMRAVAREHLSLGEMRFFYRRLKVELLKGGNDQKKTLLTSLITFAANSFVIKTNNARRIGKVYYERSRNRSIFNYLVRMIASGGASSVGAKRNKKYNRIYESKIRELQLPPIDY